MIFPAHLLLLEEKRMMCKHPTGRDFIAARVRQPEAMDPWLHFLSV